MGVSRFLRGVRCQLASLANQSLGLGGGEDVKRAVTVDSVFTFVDESRLIVVKALGYLRLH